MKTGRQCENAICKATCKCIALTMMEQMVTLHRSFYIHLPTTKFALFFAKQDDNPAMCAPREWPTMVNLEASIPSAFKKSIIWATYSDIIPTRSLAHTYSFRAIAHQSISMTLQSQRSRKAVKQEKHNNLQNYYHVLLMVFISLRNKKNTATD